MFLFIGLAEQLKVKEVLPEKDCSGARDFTVLFTRRKACLLSLLLVRLLIGDQYRVQAVNAIVHVAKTAPPMYQ